MATKEKPNIVIMLSDDVGYSDLGCYGGGTMRDHPTPHLDRMAAEGMKFTDFYTQPTCTPSRAALLTGRLPIRTGLTHVLAPRTNEGMPPSEYTLGRLMSDAGYSTAMYGKNHVGDNEASIPSNFGFDEFWGFVYHLDALEYHRMWDFPQDDDYIKRWRALQIIEGQKGKGWNEVDFLDTPEFQSIIDRKIADRSVKFIRDHAQDEQPFFLHVCWSKCHVNVYPHPEFKRLSQAGRYGDGLMEMDHHCGMVLNAIREAGIAENTLVIWTSDNGPMIASYEGTQTGITLFRGQKGGTWEGGMRQPLIAWWPGTIAPGTSTGELMTIMDLYTTCAHLAGAGHKIEELRKDRVVDGNNQVPLLKGTGPSATKTVFYYNHNRLMAIRGCKAGSKWKLHLRYQEPWRTGGPGLAEWYGGIQEPAVPLLFDIKQDPFEMWPQSEVRAWAVVSVMEEVYAHVMEMERFPNIKQGFPLKY